MKHHFISYSTNDAQEFALDLADQLEAGPPSLPTWLDKRKLQPDDDWDTQIDRAIRTCDSLIFVMSRDSVDDASVCKREWVRALKFKKPLVLVRLHADAEVPFRLDSRQFIDFSSDRDAGLAQLRQYLQRLGHPGRPTACAEGTPGRRRTATCGGRATRTGRGSSRRSAN